MLTYFAFIDNRARADPRIMFNDEQARRDRRPKGVSGRHVASYFIW